MHLTFHIEQNMISYQTNRALKVLQKILTSDAQLVFVLNWFCQRQKFFGPYKKHRRNPIQLILATYQHDNLYKKLA